jgi:hypothetical protein
MPVSMASEKPGKTQVALVSTEVRHSSSETDVVPAVRACFEQAIRLTAAGLARWLPAHRQ